MAHTTMATERFMEGRSVITRPPMRYHGGKVEACARIIAHLPAHRVYCESFGGAVSVLLRKPRAYAEVYNDLNGDVVNLMRCLRGRGYGASLRRRCNGRSAQSRRV